MSRICSLAIDSDGIRVAGEVGWHRIFCPHSLWSPCSESLEALGKTALTERGGALGRGRLGEIRPLLRWGHDVPIDDKFRTKCPLVGSRIVRLYRIRRPVARVDTAGVWLFQRH